MRTEGILLQAHVNQLPEDEREDISRAYDAVIRVWQQAKDKKKCRIGIALALTEMEID